MFLKHFLFLDNILSAIFRYFYLVGTTDNLSPSTRKSSENASEKLPFHEHGDGNSNNIFINTEKFGIPEGERGKGSYFYIYMHDFPF